MSLLYSKDIPFSAAIFLATVTRMGNSFECSILLRSAAVRANKFTTGVFKYQAAIKKHGPGSSGDPLGS
jgi:hypothetical protein